MPIYTPLAPPAFAEKVTSPTELLPSHAEMQQKVHDHFSKEGYKLPGVEPEKEELKEEEKFWLSYECMVRYLTASKWNLTTAIERLENTLKWRREYGLYDSLTPEHVEPEALTGKEILFGYDVHGRPALYMITGRQNTEPSQRQLEFTTWIMERAVDLMGPGVETMGILINFAERGKPPPLSISRGFLNILQSHYPERLGVAIVINVPFLINAFFKLIMPFVDPVTRTKIKFNISAVEEGIFRPDNIMQQWWGGDVDFEYKHEEYWPALLKLCSDKKAVDMERWRKLGGTIGLKEWDFKQAGVLSISASEKASAAIDVSAVNEAAETEVGA